MLKHQIENILRALAFANDAATASRETASTQCEEYYNIGYQDALEAVARACGLRPEVDMIDEKGEGR